MTEAWIGNYKYFYNITGPFDLFEPYSTIGALAVGAPTFTVATYVYIILFRHPNFREKAFFRIFIAQGFVDLLAFLTNLFRYRLALFQVFARLYASLVDTYWATALCTLALSSQRAQLVAQCLLSANRLLAVSRPLDYDRWQSKFSRCGFLLLFIVPLLVAIPDMLNGFYFGAVYGDHGSIIFFSRAQLDWPVMMNIANGLATTFQFSLTIFALVCNCALSCVLMMKKEVKIAGKGLVVTTLAQFVTHLAYALIMVCYLYFPPPLRNASMFTTIALDLISILPIWLLLACSKTVRDAVIQSVSSWQKNPVSPVVGDQVTITLVSPAP